MDESSREDWRHGQQRTRLPKKAGNAPVIGDPRSVASRTLLSYQEDLVVGVENADRYLIQGVEADDYQSQWRLHPATCPTVSVRQFDRLCGRTDVARDPRYIAGRTAFLPFPGEYHKAIRPRTRLHRVVLRARCSAAGARGFPASLGGT